MAGGSQALRAAAQVFGRTMMRMAVSVMRSDETATAVNIRPIAPDVIDVNAGRPGGEWGWTPIEAWMFETGSKHPLFGDRKHWYAQPYRPILDKTATAGYPEAERVYANTRIPELAAQYGYK